MEVENMMKKYIHLAMLVLGLNVGCISYGMNKNNTLEVTLNDVLEIVLKNLCYTDALTVVRTLSGSGKIYKPDNTNPRGYKYILQPNIVDILRTVSEKTKKNSWDELVKKYNFLIRSNQEIELKLIEGLLLSDDILANSKNKKRIWSSAINNHALELIKKLLAGKCIDIDCSIIKDDYIYKTALMVAAEKGQLKTVTLLVEHGADVNYGENTTALMFAVHQRHLDVAKYLIENGADVNYRDCDNDESALTIAIQQGEPKTIKFLLENGADINAKDSDDETALMRAVQKGHLEIVKFLVENGADINAKDSGDGTALMLASQKGNLEIVKFLVENGADINAKDGDDETTLMLAVKKGHLEMVTFLVGNGADVNAKDKSGRTALVFAAEEGNSEIVEFLVKKGAFDVNAKDIALRIAAGGGHLEIIEFLMKNGANVNAKSSFLGSTALMCAAGGGHFEVAKFLVEKGANINDRNNNGATATMLTSSTPAGIKIKEFLRFYKLLIEDDEAFKLAGESIEGMEQSKPEAVVVKKSKIERDPSTDQNNNNNN